MSDTQERYIPSAMSKRFFPERHIFTEPNPTLEVRCEDKKLNRKFSQPDVHNEKTTEDLALDYARELARRGVVYIQINRLLMVIDGNVYRQAGCPELPRLPQGALRDY